ncbi:oxalurate catabolism protein HpxZ [Dermatobacter hominis]|uniref:oxalurate catabolism protein HpxZ n=1 Tax=Dermatobacter hominis TaxID=2884263 RepID=UPI001D0FBA64|nr:oxalurate catabolism protein HpxZ [Dermatobacter hominis]UDY37272.1 oxalurate catabolism protein HpxZ [Dermatobacter hominis]
MSEHEEPSAAAPEIRTPAVPAVNRPEVVAEVTEAFERYERALVANDVDVLVELFWNSDLTNRFGIDESHRGHGAISAYRREQAVATPPRDLRGTVVTTFGDDVAVVDTEFLPHGSAAVGRQSQTWIRTADGWRVASAHVSWLSGRGPA